MDMVSWVITMAEFDGNHDWVTLILKKINNGLILTICLGMILIFFIIVDSKSVALQGFGIVIILIIALAILGVYKDTKIRKQNLIK